jgi:type I restriction enzyme, S subunit
MRISLHATADVFVDGDWIESKDQDPNGDVRLIQLADIGVGKFLNRSARYLTSKKANQLKCTYLKPGDILIARMPDPIGRACLFPNLGRPCVTAVDVAILRPKNEIDAEYLVYWINSPKFHTEIASLANGATRQRVSRKKLEKLEVSLPSLGEQRRLVARIKECVNRAEEIERLQMEAMAESSAALPSLLNETFNELRSSYEPITVDRAALETRYGTSQRCHTRAEGVPILRIPNVAGGFVNYDNLKYCALEADEFDRIKLNDGDVLFVRTNGSRDLVGRSAVYRSNGTGVPFGFASYLIRVRLNQNLVYPEYLKFFLNSTQGRDEIDMRRRTSAGQYNVNSENLRSITFPCPSLEVQSSLIERLRDQENGIVAIQKELTQARQLQSGLKESILGKAFSVGL